MNVTMAEICDLISSGTPDDAADILMAALSDSSDEKERVRATELFAALRCTNTIWNGFPIGIAEHLDGGSIFTPIGSDSPNRSSYIRKEDDNRGCEDCHYVACGNKMGTRVYFVTFSTTEYNAMEMVKRWITSGTTPLDR
jgi:hypothetical protein